MSEPITSTTTYRVIYGDTDAMGVVYHSNYLNFFERSRGDLIRARGVSYRDVEGDGFALPVTQAYAHYLMPARYDDLLTIKVTVARLKRASVRFEYEILRQGEEHLGPLVTGYTLHACTDSQGRIVRLPEIVLRSLGVSQG